MKRGIVGGLCILALSWPIWAQSSQASSAAVEDSQKVDLNMALIRAAYNNNVNEINQLISEGADPNAADRLFTPLIIAARMGNMDAAKALLERGADVNRRLPGGYTALIEAAMTYKTPMVELLLQYKADPNVQLQMSGYSALHFAAGFKKTDMSQLLLQAGANPSLTDRRGRTPAAIARERDNTNMLQLLGQ